MPEVHYVKTHTPIFMEIKTGDKQFSLKNDEKYEVGDTLILEEINSKGRDTGAWAPKLVTSKQTDIKQGYVLLDMKDIRF